VFYGMCRVLRMSELDQAIQAVAGPIRRRLTR
jgi:hypothetical protein